MSHLPLEVVEAELPAPVGWRLRRPGGHQVTGQAGVISGSGLFQTEAKLDQLGVFLAVFGHLRQFGGILSLSNISTEVLRTSVF